MRRRAIQFKSPETIELIEQEIDLEELQPKQIAVESVTSVLSAGTELAVLGGNESWAPHPAIPGYGNVGRVIARGSEVTQCEEGDLVFSYASHASHALASGSQLIVKLPEDIDPVKLAMARIAQVAFTAPRVSSIELGDTVVVQGLGLVGNLAAQFCALSGARVIGVDVSEARLEMAAECGIEHRVNPLKEDLFQKVEEITEGRMCETAIEATGNPSLIAPLNKLLGKNGETILLGTPRGDLKEGGADILRQIHLWGSGCVTMKGAHEWRYPIYDSDAGKHSLERNIRIFLDLLRNGKLKVDALISHVESPENCSQVYEALRNRDESYGGVVWDWRKL
ncbi:MAG: zinc-binding alcohol dehydrogenase [Verrucomicrobiota bacterium]